MGWLPAPASRGRGRAHRVFHPLAGADLRVLAGLEDPDEGENRDLDTFHHRAIMPRRTAPVEDPRRTTGRAR